MPIYEYCCESCGDKFEKLVRRAEDAMKDATDAGCPACGEKRLRQEYSTFAARAGSPKSAGAGEMPSCPGGMCGGSGMCGRN